MARELHARSLHSDSKPIPVLLSHDGARVVGHVVTPSRIVIGTSLTHARRVTHPRVRRLRHAQTRYASLTGIQTTSVGSLLAKDGYKHYNLAKLDEISILRPNEISAYRDAKVAQVLELKDSPAVRATTTSDRAEVLYGDGTTITRYGIGQVLGVR